MASLTVKVMKSVKSFLSQFGLPTDSKRQQGQALVWKADAHVLRW